MFLVGFVCLFVCGQHYSKTYERIGMKFYGGVLGSTMKNWLNFGGDLDILRSVNEQKSTIMVVAYPDTGAGNDPNFFLLFFLFFLGGGGSLSPPRLNIFTVGNTGVMICLGQGGLRSLSASSLFVCLSVDNITQKVMNRLGWNLMEGSLGSTRKNWLNFGGDLGILRWVNERKNTIIVVAYSDGGAG